MNHWAYLWSKILNRDLHIPIGIFLLQQGVEGFVHVDEELAGFVA